MYLKQVVLVFLFGFIVHQGAYAFDPHAIERRADKTIEQLYHKLGAKPNASMAERITIISAYFIGKPYIGGSLGEGATARFDQYPQYCTDGFDCETYVTTVLALALASDNTSFQQCLLKVRYKNGKRSFMNRNHFTSLDWNTNNQQQGFLKDITQTIRNEKNQPIAKIATTLIEKPSWYQHKKYQDIRLTKPSESEQKRRLEELQEKAARNLFSQEASIPYLPLDQLFTKDGQPDEQLFAQIPNGAIIEIVRPNWNLRELIGTNLNVSHLGFAIRSGGVLYFREASSKEAKVIDIPLTAYLTEALKSPTIKGINIQVVVPEKPFTKGCP